MPFNSGFTMSSTPVTARPMPGYSDEGHRLQDERHRSRFSLRPVIEATGCILLGAGIGSVAIIVGVWVLMRVTNSDDISVPTPAAAIAPHHLVR